MDATAGKTYITDQVGLSDFQKRKIANAYNQSKGVAIQLSASGLRGNNKILLTRTQAENLNTARRKRTGIRLILSKTQLSQSGGALPWLIPLLAGLTPIVGKALLSGAVGEAGKKIYNKATGNGLKKSVERDYIFRERDNEY